MRHFLMVLAMFNFTFFPVAWSSDDEDHGHAEGERHDEKAKHGHDEAEEHAEEAKHGHDEGKEHDEEAGHAHDEGEGEEDHGKEETPESVGPNKGITSYSEKDGFKLSSEATKTFGIATTPLQGSSPWDVPNTSIVRTAAEAGIYRVRGGNYKHIDVTVIKKGTTATITSKSLKSGDQVVVKGANFLKVAELDLTSGESGHHH